MLWRQIIAFIARCDGDHKRWRRAARVWGRGVHYLIMLSVAEIIQCLWWMDEITYECGALLKYMDRNTKYSQKKNYPCNFSAINPTWCVLGLNLWLYDERPGKQFCGSWWRDEMRYYFSWSGLLVRTPTFPHLAQIFPAFYHTLRFITVFHSRLPCVLISS